MQMVIDYIVVFYIHYFKNNELIDNAILKYFNAYFALVMNEFAERLLYDGYTIKEMASLAGGGDPEESEKSDEKKEETKEEKEKTETFEDEHGKGTVTYDEKGNYNVSYDDGTGFGHSDGTSYEYGSDENSSYLTETDIDGNLVSAYGNINDSVEGYENGISNTYTDTFYGSDISTTGYKTEEGFLGDVSVAVTENTYNIGDYSMTSMIDDVSINGVDTGIFGALGYSLYGAKGAQIGSVLSDVFGLYVGGTLLKGGFALLSAPTTTAKMLGVSISVPSVQDIIKSTENINSVLGLTVHNSNTLNQNYISSSDGKKNSIVKINETELIQSKIYYENMLTNENIDKSYSFRAGGEYYNSGPGSTGHKVSTIFEPTSIELGFNNKADKFLDDIVFANKNINYIKEK